jgi:P-type conjugative transfer protein TrbJ
MKRFASLLVIGLFAVLPWSAGAQIAVIDASNLAQNIMTAARTLQTVTNQITQIQQTVQMLENQARNLTSLNVSNLNSLTTSLSTLQNLMNSAQGIVFDIARTGQQFQQSYPQQYSAATTSNQFFQDAQTRWLNSVQAFNQSVQTQSRIVTDIPTDQRNLQQAVSASQGAVGILQATQATNQLIALQIKQTSELQAMLAAQGRAEDLEMARRATTEEAAQVQLQQFIGTGPQYTPQPVQVFR